MRQGKCKFIIDTIIRFILSKDVIKKKGNWENENHVVGIKKLFFMGHWPSG